MELTRIVDTLLADDGTKLNGRLIATPSKPFTAADGTEIVAGPNQFVISNGVVDLQLAPTEDSVPAVTYRVAYITKPGRLSEIWILPRTGGPFTVAQVKQ